VPTEVLVASGVCQTSSSVAGVGSYRVTCAGAGGSASYSAAADCSNAGAVPAGGFTNGKCYTAPGAAAAPAAQSYSITCGSGGLDAAASFAPVASSSSGAGVGAAVATAAGGVAAVAALAAAAAARRA